LGNTAAHIVASSFMKRRNFLYSLASASLACAMMGGGRSARANAPDVSLHDSDDRFPIDHTEVLKVEPAFRRVEVSYPTALNPGTLVVDPGAKYLYLVLEGERALRYGVGVGREGFEWSGEAIIGRTAKWPRWTPTKSMVARDPDAAKWAGGMPGGPDNPLGARALYLYKEGVDTLYRIHGTNQPQSIGKAASSGCIRLLNADIADLYTRVRVGAKVLVLPVMPPRDTLMSRENGGVGRRGRPYAPPSLY
jgi:lipoprotein-anchoring transpeptidase ErfK/SrfK